MGTETATALVGVAGIVGTLAGVWLTSFYSKKSLEAQIKAEHQKTLLQLRHDKLMEAAGLAGRIGAMPSLWVEVPTADQRKALFMALTSMETYEGYLSVTKELRQAYFNFYKAVGNRLQAQPYEVPWDQVAWNKAIIPPETALINAVNQYLGAMQD